MIEECLLRTVTRTGQYSSRLWLFHFKMNSRLITVEKVCIILLYRYKVKYSIVSCMPRESEPNACHVDTCSVNLLFVCLRTIRSLAVIHDALTPSLSSKPFIACFRLVQVLRSLIRKFIPCTYSMTSHEVVPLASGPGVVDVPSSSIRTNWHEAEVSFGFASCYAQP